MTVRDHVLRGDATSEHLVQLFDEPESRAHSVAAFLYDAWRKGAPMLVAAKAANWVMISGRLERLGCPVATIIAEGRLVVLDAATTLATFMRNGWPDDVRFDDYVGDTVARLSLLGPRLHVYGEMVDILAEQANLDAAHHLEMLWNDLLSQYSFTLLCGYCSGHFGDPRDAGALHRICRAHTRIGSSDADLLASWLLGESADLRA